jgi:flagellar hook assembly protein FlgD
VADKIGKEAEIAVIQTFRLLQNYPNPFNPCTTIEYQIPEGGKVSVSIFSLNGNLLKTIERTHAAPGPYTVEWDGKDAAGQTSASGFYIYRVSYSHSVIAKKMLLLK